MNKIERSIIWVVLFLGTLGVGLSIYFEHFEWQGPYSLSGITNHEVVSFLREVGFAFIVAFIVGFTIDRYSRKKH